MARNAGVRSARKEKQWEAIPSIIDTMTGNATSVGGSLGFSSKQTVLRMLGEYVVNPSLATAAADQVKITLGLAKVSTDAATLGATAVPDPAGDANFSWLYWAEHVFFFGGTSADPASGASYLRRSFDIRTMRKFGPAESLLWVFQYSNIAGNPPVTLSVGQTRVLLTIH